MKPNLSVILPCYNTPNLLENFLEVQKVVSDITDKYEIILVNDGSAEFPDIKQSEYIKVITNKKNMGKGYSLRKGFASARGRVIAFIDSDLQIPASTLASYYEIMNGSRNPDILVGSKRHKNSTIIYPWLRRLYSLGFQIMNKYMFGLILLDTQGGIKFLRRDVIKDLLPYLHTNGFAIDLEILSLAQRKGYKILEGPIRVEESFSSTVKIKDVFRMLRDSLKIWFRFKFKEGYNGKD